MKLMRSALRMTRLLYDTSGLRPGDSVYLVHILFSFCDFLATAFVVKFGK